MFRPKSPEDFRDGCKISAFGFVFAALFLGGAAYVYPMIGKQQKAPLEITAADIGRVSRPEDLAAPRVTFTVETSVPTELASIDAVSNRVEHVYRLAQVGDRWLLVAVPNNFQGNRFTGTLITVPRFEFDQMFEATKAIHQGNLMPFQFDAVPHPGTDIKYAFYVLLGFSGFGGLLLLCGLIAVVKSFSGEPRAEATEQTSLPDDEPVEVDPSVFAKLNG
jgi:hypothetical protein